MSKAPLEKAAFIINNGGIVAYATEFCFGLACDPRNPRALQRLLRLKKRPWQKGLILLAADINQINEFVLDIPESAKKHWPGAVTCLLPARTNVLYQLRGRSTKVAVRVTAHEQAAALCLAAGSAIVSTSANRAGQQPVRSYREAVRRLRGLCDYILPGRVSAGQQQASTIIDPYSGKKLRY
jgi:L-threonylcarbamoyladenylate synthase